MIAVAADMTVVAGGMEHEDTGLEVLVDSTRRVGRNTEVLVAGSKVVSGGGVEVSALVGNGEMDGLNQNGYLKSKNITGCLCSEQSYHVWWCFGFFHCLIVLMQHSFL